MKLTLNKKKIKNLSKDEATIPADMTPQIGGGGPRGLPPTNPGQGGDCSYSNNTACSKCLC